MDKLTKDNCLIISKTVVESPTFKELVFLNRINCLDKLNCSHLLTALTWGSPTNPAVLLCHGKLDACSGFRPLVSLLPDCFYYVSVDLPGNGRSTHLPKGLRYVAKLTALIKPFFVLI